MTVKKQVSSTKGDVAEIFRHLNLPTDERSLSSLRTFWFDPTIAPQMPGVSYRTVLTNGTGRATAPANAELE